MQKGKKLRANKIYPILPQCLTNMLRKSPKNYVTSICNWLQIQFGQEADQPAIWLLGVHAFVSLFNSKYANLKGKTWWQSDIVLATCFQGLQVEISTAEYQPFVWNTIFNVN